MGFHLHPTLQYHLAFYRDGMTKPVSKLKAYISLSKYVAVCMIPMQLMLTIFKYNQSIEHT